MFRGIDESYPTLVVPVRYDAGSEGERERGTEGGDKERAKFNRTPTAALILDAKCSREASSGPFIG